ncbi:dTMP kinase [Thermosporothrix hazakensis]|uniref:Thymidylate kinase n=2 Tax=Thermosporothrix TaxID=768650 RepID=A0A326UFZ1_THEHA|nr:dTMP kinase [Thermosporothrix hazakensis]PZW35930.1 dTMP kinase [Thermosporothrix hazakensis]BBH88398.1 thymidylate kinase [Thermosporothrix sp. COM3]GCE46585.1 thymidylate kinase [Thermosporothrix hazakensis]
MRKGLFISFEGLDGAGKTTQLQLLHHWLEQRGVDFLRTREPGGTPLGVEIRRLLLERADLHVTPLAEAFLFQADRAQHFATVIVPALDAGKLVLTDRCFDSSMVYQGAARGLGTDLIRRLSLLAMGGRVPDLTILLDLDPAKVHSRTAEGKDRAHRTHFDQAEEAFHRTLRSAFLALAQAHPERIKVIDASLPPDVVHAHIIALIEPLLQQNEG